MVISLTHYAGSALLKDVPPSRIKLHDSDDTQFLITFFYTASGNISFLEVALDQFTAEGTQKLNGKEPVPHAHPDAGNTEKPNNGIPQERRLALRRIQPDRRATLRWQSNGGDRRHGPGRRKEDRRDIMNAVLSKLLSVPTGRMQRRERTA